MVASDVLERVVAYCVQREYEPDPAANASTTVSTCKNFQKTGRRFEALITNLHSCRRLKSVSRKRSGRSSWGGSRDFNPRHSDAQSYALPADPVPPEIPLSLR